MDNRWYHVNLSDWRSLIMFNAVGIDVSKGKSTVSVLQPGGTVVKKPFNVVHSLILSILVDTFFSRISLTMLPVPNSHNTSCVLS